MISRPDWGLAAASAVGLLLLSAAGVIPPPDGMALFNGALRNPYYTGSVAVLLLVWGEMVARLLPASGARGVRLAGVSIAALVTGWCFFSWPSGITDQWISRLYLAAAAGMLAAVVGVVLFLIASGVTPIARVAGTLREWGMVFAPFFILIGGAGCGVTLVSQLRPAVDDPLLLRMDESLGFHASFFFGSLDYVGTWLWDAQFVVYAGVGAFVLGVAGALLLAGRHFAVQRCMLALILGGCSAGSAIGNFRRWGSPPPTRSFSTAHPRPGRRRWRWPWPVLPRWSSRWRSGAIVSPRSMPRGRCWR